MVLYYLRTHLSESTEAGQRGQGKRSPGPAPQRPRPGLAWRDQALREVIISATAVIITMRPCGWRPNTICSGDNQRNEDKQPGVEYWQGMGRGWVWAGWGRLGVGRLGEEA